MNDGTTPLILAARLAVEGMVEELIHCHADINAVDDHGTHLYIYQLSPTPEIPNMLLNDSRGGSYLCPLIVYPPRDPEGAKAVSDVDLCSSHCGQLIVLNMFIL